MNEIEYKIEFFDILKNLSTITNAEIVINSHGDNIIVRRVDKDFTIAYELIASKKCFNLNINEIGFYKYTEFYQYLKSLSNPTITIEDNYIIMSTKSSKTKS